MPSAPNLRLFVALAPPANVRARLVALQHALAEIIGDASLQLIAAEDLHLTLRFLGDTPSQRIAAITAELDRIAAAHSVPTIRSATSAGWPPRAARVLVLEFRDDPLTSDLTAQLERAALRLGYRAETRPFRPHVTLARSRQPLPTVPQSGAEPIDWQPDTLDLYVSEPAASGQPRYRRLHASAFASASG